MNNNTFGIIIGVVIALAVAMFAGLYMLGLSGVPSTTSFDDGYGYNNDSQVDTDNGYSDYDYETYDEYYYAADGEVYKDDGAYFYFDEGAAPEGDYYEYESLDYQEAPATQ